MNFIILDYETGGFDGEKDAVTEMGMTALCGNTLKQLEQYSTYIKPYEGFNYGQQALTATNISLELLNAEGIPVKEAVQQQEAFFAKYSSTKMMDKAVFVGHNPLFDIMFANTLHNKFGKTKLEKYFQGKQYGHLFIPQHIDTGTLGKMMFSKSSIPNYKLGTIIEKAGLELSDAHKAINDVIATEDYLRLCMQKLRNTSQSTSADSSDSNTEKNYSRFRTTFQI